MATRQHDADALSIELKTYIWYNIFINKRK